MGRNSTRHLCRVPHGWHNDQARCSSSQSSPEQSDQVRQVGCYSRSTDFPLRQLAYGMSWPSSSHRRLAGASPLSQKRPWRQLFCFNACQWLFKEGMRSPSNTHWHPNEMSLQPFEHCLVFIFMPTGFVLVGQNKKEKKKNNNNFELLYAIMNWIELNRWLPWTMSLEDNKDDCWNCFLSNCTLYSDIFVVDRKAKVDFRCCT